MWVAINTWKITIRKYRPVVMHHNVTEARCIQEGPQGLKSISSPRDLPLSYKKGCLDVALYVISGLSADVRVGYTAQGRLTMNSIDLVSADKASRYLLLRT